MPVYTTSPKSYLRQVALVDAHLYAHPGAHVQVAGLVPHCEDARHLVDGHNAGLPHAQQAHASAGLRDGGDHGHDEGGDRGSQESTHGEMKVMRTACDLKKGQGRVRGSPLMNGTVAGEYFRCALDLQDTAEKPVPNEEQITCVSVQAERPPLSREYVWLHILLTSITRIVCFRRATQSKLLGTTVEASLDAGMTMDGHGRVPEVMSHFFPTQ